MKKKRKKKERKNSLVSHNLIFYYYYSLDTPDYSIAFVQYPSFSCLCDTRDIVLGRI